MKASSLFVLALVLGSLLYLAPAVNAAPQQSPLFYVSSYWGYNTTVITAYPGAVALPLTVKALYAGPLTLYNVSMQVKPRFPISPISGEKNSSIFLPELVPGTSVSLVGLYNVSSLASLRVYNETLSITYYVALELPQVGTTLVKGQEQLNFSVPITGYYGVRLVGFKTTPVAIYAGETAGALTLYLANNGNSIASNVNISAEFAWPLSALYPGSNSVYIAYMPPGRVINVTFPFSIGNYTTTRLVKLPTGAYIQASIPAALNTTVKVVARTSSENYTFYIPLAIMPSAHFTLVQVYYPTLTAGGSSYVTVELENIGESESRFTTLTLLMGPVFTPYAPSSENPLIAIESINQSVGDIASGQEVNATFVVSVASNIKPGTYYLPILVSWRQQPTMSAMYQIIEVPLVVKSPSVLSISDGLSTTWLYIIAAVVIIILVALVLLGRRK